MMTLDCLVLIFQKIALNLKYCMLMTSYIIYFLFYIIFIFIRILSVGDRPKVQ
jgi:hypothetical protein